MLQSLDQCGISRIWISAHSAVGPDMWRGNDEVAAVVTAHSDRFVGYATINPNYGREAAEDELERCFGQLGMKAVKIHPGLHGQSVAEEGYEVVWEYASDKSVIVLSHTWNACPYSDPLLFSEVARRYPKARILLGHSGGEFEGYLKAIKAAKEFENLYLDITGSQVMYGTVEMLVREVGDERVLFGTDTPFLDPRPQVGRVIYSRLPERTKRKILGLNFLSLSK